MELTLYSKLAAIIFCFLTKDIIIKNDDSMKQEIQKTNIISNQIDQIQSNHQSIIKSNQNKSLSIKSVTI